jgi:hypothetical protein
LLPKTASSWTRLSRLLADAMLLLTPLLATLAFSTRSPLPLSRPHATRTEVRCCERPPEPPTEMTKVGSKAYYEGFFTQPVDESVTQERGDGTEQAVKFAASSAGVIGVLFLGFMASNGLLG